MLPPKDPDQGLADRQRESLIPEVVTVKLRGENIDFRVQGVKVRAQGVWVQTSQLGF